ncbi:hypothetical protein P12x_005273 [Tundrisphaera lichenicola]|uniref:hypothetical protein n=1 Tax=Tundrisphaera lichenicola TaxID=2029860 RepID=UPI003EB9726F
MGKRNKIRKATNDAVTLPMLVKRTDILKNAGYDKPKWIGFCETLLDRGYILTLYEARQTFSKYITVSMAGHKPFKVRFSNHKPIAQRELNGDCDFFVGVTNLCVTNTSQALIAVEKHFQQEPTKGTTNA